MSGTNPFRRGTPAAGSDDHPGPAGTPLRTIDTAVTETPVRKSKTTKTVRIVSPQSANESTGSFPQALTSPPPPASSFGDHAGGDDDDETDSAIGDAENPFGSATGGGSTRAAAEDDSRPREIQRPAARPLRSSLKQTAAPPLPQRSAARSDDTSGRPTGSEIGRDTNDPQYDVDRFTRLLLSGRKDTTNPTATPPPPVSFQVSPNAGDSSSNTDASSISRQSLFDSIFEARRETPKSSHEPSPAEESSSVLLAGSLSQDSTTKPLVPRTKHGKPLTEAQPSLTFQTSKASSEKLSDSPPEEAIEPIHSAPSPSNLDKPLPAPPQAVMISSTDMQSDANTEARPTTALLSEPSSPIRSQAPPPPPPARRHSQRRPRSYLGNPNQPETISEDNKSETPIAVEIPRSSDAPQGILSETKPPLPPPRRTRASRSDSKSSISSARSIPSISERLNVPTDALGSSPVKSPPPLPPSRHPGSASSKRGPHPSSSGHASLPPPPPPPSRIRGSSQSSTSSSSIFSGGGDYRSSLSGNDHRNSGSSSPLAFHYGSEDHASLHKRPLGVDDDDEEQQQQQQQQDVMADLTALQREVDELRGKFGR